MDRLSTGDSEAQKAICEALGLDPAITRGLTIEMHAGGVGLMRVTQFLTEDQVAKLRSAVSRFEYTTTKCAG